MGTLLSLIEGVADYELGAILIAILIAIILSILPIILFFKVWRMSNDVNKMKSVLDDIYFYLRTHKE